MTVIVRRSFLAGRMMGEVVEDERRESIATLQQHGLEFAAFAMGERRSSSFQDFMRTRGAMLAGGIHRVRLKGGRGLCP